MINSRIRWHSGSLAAGLAMLTLGLYVLAAPAAGNTARAGAARSLWDMETLLVVEAAAPHFDYDSAGWQADGQENFSFSYIDPATGDLRVAHVDGNEVETAVVAHGQTPIRPAGIGNDLAGTSLSYSQPNVIGGSGVAIARLDGSGWTSETISPINGGGSTFMLPAGYHHSVHAPSVLYSGPNGLFIAREDDGGSGWLSTAVDAEAKADTAISLAFDRMSFPSIAYCGRSDEGDVIKAAWLDFDAKRWDPVTITHQPCVDIWHYGAWFGGDAGQFIYSTGEQLKFLIGSVSDPRIYTIDDAAAGGWVGRGLSAYSDVIDYWVTYTAYDAVSGMTSLRAATSAGGETYGDWQMMEGPSGDFAAWTYLEDFEMKDDRLVKISMLYYDIGQGALKRATWPPEPDFFLPVIR